MTIGLILANIAVFIMEILPPGGTAESLQALAAVPRDILHGQTTTFGIPLPYTLITSQFLHGDVFHLGFNMLFLWIFGDNVEDAYGHGRYILFYLLCGVTAAMAHILSAADSTIPLIGASGAISGILGAYIIMHPRARVDTLVWIIIFVRIIRIPAFLFLGIWFAMQVLNSSGGGGVAWYAHIGGFLCGFLLTILGGKNTRR